MGKRLADRESKSCAKSRKVVRGCFWDFFSAYLYLLWPTGQFDRFCGSVVLPEEFCVISVLFQNGVL